MADQQGPKPANDNPAEPVVDPSHPVVKKLVQALRDTRDLPDYKRVDRIIAILGAELTPDMVQAGVEAWSYIRVMNELYEKTHLHKYSKWTYPMIQIPFVHQKMLCVLFGMNFVAPAQLVAEGETPPG